MLMEMAGSRSCGGRAFQDNGLDEENAREPNVDVAATYSRLRTLKQDVEYVSIRTVRIFQKENTYATNPRALLYILLPPWTNKQTTAA